MNNQEAISTHLSAPFSLMYLINKSNGTRLHLTADGCTNPRVSLVITANGKTLASTILNRSKKGNNFINKVLDYVTKLNLSFETKI